MTPRAMFAKSLVIAPCEAALRRAETHVELDAAWEDYCTGFAAGSHERRHLISLYHDCYEAIGRRASAVVALTEILGAG